VAQLGLDRRSARGPRRDPARPASAARGVSVSDGTRRHIAWRWRGTLALWRRPHRHTGDGRGKRGGAHWCVDGGAARRRRRRRRVTRRAWTPASAARWLGGDRRRPTGTREKISADGGTRDATTRPHSLAHGRCRQQRRQLRTRRR
jgi:hypothetical protein